MKKLILILTSVFLVMAWLAPASAQDPYPPYRYAKWQGIWQEEPVESTVGGDAWIVNGKWVTGHFTRNGVWVRPGKRTPSDGWAGWYSPGWGTSWYDRHNGSGCRPVRPFHCR